MMKWTLRLAGLAAALFLVYFLANLSALYARVKLDRSYPALSRYAFERTPDVAVVGSSMSFRIYEDYFETPLRNMSIGGRSSSTGLKIIASYPSVPTVVLVEANILRREIDQNLVAAFGDNKSEPFRWFRPARAVISWLYYWIKHEPRAGTARRLLTGEPASYDIAASVNSELKWSESFNRQQWETSLQPRVQDLKQTAQELERRGCRIVLFELPAPTGLRDTDYVRAAHDLVKQAFPATDQWLEITDPRNELRWVDGSHMDERSAALVAQQIDRYLAAMKLKVR